MEIQDKRADLERAEATATLAVSTFEKKVPYWQTRVEVAERTLAEERMHLADVEARLAGAKAALTAATAARSAYETKVRPAIARIRDDIDRALAS